MIKQPELNTIFSPQPKLNATIQNALKAANLEKPKDGIVINIHLSKRALRHYCGWLLSVLVWGSVFAFLLMR